MSLEMIDLVGVGPREAILDVGGGAAPLAGSLLGRGFEDVSVLDLSQQGLSAAAQALGAEGSRVEWIRADILDWSPPRTYGLWHDRAVLHFLVDARSRARYRETLLAALRPGGHVVVGTFAEDGPARCSGLPVARYDAEALAGVFGPGFATVARSRDEHSTPSGARQAFTWLALRRRD